MASWDVLTITCVVINTLSTARATGTLSASSAAWCCAESKALTFEGRMRAFFMVALVACSACCTPSTTGLWCSSLPLRDLRLLLLRMDFECSGLEASEGWLACPLLLCDSR